MTVMVVAITRDEARVWRRGLDAHLEHRHPEIADKVVGNVDSDLNALTENQILSLARDWFEQYHRWGFASDEP